MKIRQTFTISPEVSTLAKNYARRKGVSLSSLVERLLREEVGTTATSRIEHAPFSKRWAGTAHLSQSSDPRTQRLRKKYQL